MANSIPSYELYGELLAGELPGPIHHETIRERSSQHDWTIRLHRHRRLAQIFLFSSADVFLRVGDIEYTSSDQIILVVPPGVPHGFRFSEDIVGDVVSIRLDEMPATVQQRFAVFNEGTGRIFTGRRADNFDNVAALIDQLRQAYHSVAVNKEEVLLSLIDLIVLYLTGDLRTASSLKPVNTPAPRGRHDLQIEAFCNLLEENFQHPWSVALYAQRIGISAPHLTRVCKAGLGAPPNDLVRRRRILEAKRLLEYTALSVAEIARRCGFKDAAFFSRTFKASLGIPPHQYRTQLNE
jgi:AraC family transcriptional activator of pobA